MWVFSTKVGGTSYSKWLSKEGVFQDVNGGRAAAGTAIQALQSIGNTHNSLLITQELISDFKVMLTILTWAPLGPLDWETGWGWVSRGTKLGGGDSGLEGGKRVRLEEREPARQLTAFPTLAGASLHGSNTSLPLTCKSLNWLLINKIDYWLY